MKIPTLIHNWAAEIILLSIIILSALFLYKSFADKKFREDLSFQRNEAQRNLNLGFAKIQYELSSIQIEAIRIIEDHLSQKFDHKKSLLKFFRLVHNYPQIDSLLIWSNDDLTIVNGDILSGFDIKTVSRFKEMSISEQSSLSSGGIFRGLASRPIQKVIREEIFPLPNFDSSNEIQGKLVLNSQLSSIHNESPVSIQIYVDLARHLNQYLQDLSANQIIVSLDGIQLNSEMDFNTAEIPLHSSLINEQIALSKATDTKVEKSFSIGSSSVIISKSLPIEQVNYLENFGSVEGSIITLSLIAVLLLFTVLKRKITLLTRNLARFKENETLLGFQIGAFLKSDNSFLYQTDINGKFTYLSPNVKQITGYDPEELMGLRTFPNLANKSLEFNINPLSPRRREIVEVHSKFDEILVLELSEDVLENSANEVIGKVGIARNVSLNSKIEKENHKNGQYRSALFESIPDAILTLDKQGFLMEWKRPMGFEFPFVVIDEPGTPVYKVFPAILSIGIKEAFEEAVKSKQSIAKEIMFKDDSSEFHYEVRAISLSSENVMILIRDITSQKLIENNLQKEKDIAQELALAKDEFISIVSHELKTPLNGILGMSHLLEETSLSEEQKKYLQTLKFSTNSLHSIISDILDYSKLSNGEVGIKENEFRIQEIIEFVIQLYTPQARSKGLELKTKFDQNNNLIIKNDFGKITQILSQLISNAIKFTENGQIEISAIFDQQVNNLQFIIHDTGIGIPHDKLELLCQPFTQIDSSDKRKYGGTGLGLAIATRLSNLLGGSIKAESVLGQGSTFTLTIPLKRVNDGSEQRIPHQETVVLIDSNPISNLLISEKLRREGYIVLNRQGDFEGLNLINLLLINKNTALTEEEKNLMLNLKPKARKTLSFTMGEGHTKTYDIPAAVDNEIKLNKTASNLKESILKAI
jgi:PAS domain S-box-containing protein